MGLSQKSCVPCRGGIPPLDAGAIERLMQELHADWRAIDNHHLVRTFAFDDFKGALDFTVALGAVAEEQGHHPDIHLAWGKVAVEIWTHKIDGLTESDFILAAKYDAL